MANDRRNHSDFDAQAMSTFARDLAARLGPEQPPRPGEFERLQTRALHAIRLRLRERRLAITTSALALAALVTAMILTPARRPPHPAPMSTSPGYQAIYEPIGGYEASLTGMASLLQIQAPP